MKRKKRTLALLLVSALLLASCPLFVSAGEVYVSDVIGKVASLSSKGNYSITGILIDYNGRLAVITPGWFYEENAAYEFYGKNCAGAALTPTFYAADGSFVLFTFQEPEPDLERLYIHNTPMPDAGGEVLVYYLNDSDVDYIEDLQDASLENVSDSIGATYKGYFFLDNGLDEVADGAAIILGQNVMGMFCSWAIDEKLDDVYYTDLCVSFYKIADDLGLHNQYYMGDVDFDGSVTSSDARLILRCAVELETFNTAQAALGDMDGDGVISSSDARLALRTAVELEPLRVYA